jgi:DNA helicase-2/ATP-dependent DNA helicase PcrA
VGIGAIVGGLHQETLKIADTTAHPFVIVGSVISCVYCGGAHARPADVKQCWADGQNVGGEAHANAVSSVETASERAVIPHIATTGCVLRRGPRVLGRSVIVTPGQTEPDEWRGCPRVPVDAVLDAHRAGAEAMVIELDAHVEPASMAGEIDHRPQHELGPGHTFAGDELYHRVWSNSIDARQPDLPRWAIAESALALGASLPHGGQAGDIVLPDGRPAWIDAGAVRHLDPIDGVVVVHAVQVANRRLEVARPNVTSADLASDQLAAVTHDAGSARIIAPAGSGKTRVLTERARHLLEVWRWPPEALSLVAFNKRAQQEISARTTDLTGLNVRTLNSIALAIINGTPPFAPQHGQWRTIDEPDVRAILARFVQSPRRLNVDPLAPWIDALSLLRLGLVDPAEVEARYGGDVDGLAEVWPMYRDALERQRVVDFDDQIRRALDVLLTQPKARVVAQAACRVLLVDEFQDLTPAHLLLIRLLSGPAGAVFGVGDDDQTIYGYNGADPAWLIDFARWFPGAGDHPLEVNYRCPSGLVEVADRLLRHNRRRVAKTIRAAAAPAAGRPGWSVVGGDDPVGDTVVAVQRAIAGGSSAADVAVLTRVNATLAPVQVALTAAGVSISGGVGTDFLERTAVRAAIAWLRLAGGRPFTAADLGEALRRPSRGLHPRVRDWVAEQRDVAGLLRLADRVTTEKDAARIADFAGDIGRLQALARNGHTTRLLAALIDEIGLGGAVATLDANRQGMNRSAQGDDLLALRQLGRLHPDPSTFEAWLRSALATRRDPAGVVLSTVHRVKGQEWPHVVVHMAADDQFPHRLAEDVEEERRLFHVAITRASQHVTVVTGDSPSPLVDELTTEPDPMLRHDPSPGPARVTAARRTPTKAAAADHPLLERDRVMAVIGLVLVDQGQTWTITELEPAAAVAERNGAVRKFALGEKVETAGRQRGPLRPRPGDVEEPSVRMFDALRSYRERVREGKPAYTVFDDKTLVALATALATDAAELAAVKGIGPAKLEQYGDDLITLATEALGAA